MVVQVVMAVFSYLYYNNYIAKLATVSLGTVLNSIAQMDTKSQFELFSQLGTMLAAKRQISGPPPPPCRPHPTSPLRPYTHSHPSTHMK